MLNTSITKNLLLFYLLINSSLLQPLLSKQWVETVQENRIIKHILGLTTIFTLILLMSDGSDDYASMVAVAALGYVWFLFSTKMDIHLNIIIIMLLLGSVIYDSKTKKENNQIEDDKNITDHMKDSLIAQNDKNGKYVMFGIMGIIVSFMLLYSNKKEVQHGGGYSAVNFLLY
jgi:hypothetical protein